MNCIFLRRGYEEASDGVNYVEYIQSSGTQWINTLVKPTYKTRVVLDISDLTSVVTMVLGSKNADSATASDQFAIYRNTSTTIRSDYFGTNATATISDTTQRSTIDKNANVVTMYGTTLTNTAVSSGTGSYNMYLFALNTADDSSKTFPSSFKLYSCQIYDDGTLVRDFRPALDPDGVACLYDKVTKTYYYNAGTGEFYWSGNPAPSTFTLSFTGKYAKTGANYCYYAVDGEEYTSAQEFELESEAEVTVYVKSQNYASTITIDGTQVVSVKGGTSGSYTFAVTSNTTVVSTSSGNGSNMYYAVVITTS